MLRIELDHPLEFGRQRCDICNHEDADWCILHFLADGVWRKLQPGVTLRDQGLDESDTSRLYFIHGCTEAIMRTFVSLKEIRQFLDSLNGDSPTGEK